MINKKSIWSFVLAICLAVPAMFMLSACGKDKGGSGEPEHTHTYGSVWQHDETHHWHAATCEHTTEKGDYAEHVGSWVELTPADYGVNKKEKFVCSICLYETTREVEDSALQPDANEITVDTINFTYSGKPQAIDGLVSAKNKVGMTIKYEKKDGETYTELTETPKNAGSYRYTITIPASATKEYAKSEKTGTFEIKKYQVKCPSEVVSYLPKGQTATTKVCDIDLSDDENINLEDVELVYSNPDKPEGYGAGRVNINIAKNRIKVTPALADNIEIDFSKNGQYIQWIVLDENDEFSLKYSEMVDANSCYIGTVEHGYAKVGDKLTILNYNDSNNVFTKVNVTVTAIEYLTNPYDDNKVYKTTSYATKDDKIRITFTKDNASDNIASVRNIVSARETYEVSNYDGYKSKIVDLSFGSSEFRMLKFKIGTSTKCKLTISDAENSKLLKVFNAATGAEITLTEGTFTVAEGTEIYIVIQQGLTKGNQEVTVKLVEYTIGA